MGTIAREAVVRDQLGVSVCNGECRFIHNHSAHTNMISFVFASARIEVLVLRMHCLGSSSFRKSSFSQPSLSIRRGDNKGPN